jgi:HK97 family phage prohead protease
MAGVFRGLASTFGGPPDHHGHIVDAGAFSKSLAVHAARGTRPALLWSHDQDQPIGTWLDLQETDEGLEAVGKLNLEVAKAREVYALMKDGALALSIGFLIHPGGSKHAADGRHLTELELIEISPVALPANTNARVTQVKGEFHTPNQLERAVRDALGLSARQAKRLIAGGWPAMVRDEPTEDENTEQAVKAALSRIINA